MAFTPDFSASSRFNPKANFVGMKYSDKTPVLASEDMEEIDIQNHLRAEIVRDSIPSGFIKLGELDYNYMLNNENRVRLKSDSIAYVNGYKVFIPAGTTVDIGKAPEQKSREDLLFLEMWFEEVGYQSTLTEYGGEGRPTIKNEILDGNIGLETSKRVALKWRIRHVADVDFNKYTLDGFKVNNIFLQQEHYCPNITIQGGNALPIEFYNISANTFVNYLHYAPNSTRLHEYGKSVKLPQTDDVGLYIGGKGDDKSKSELKTLDGYVYAIPMFRLYRKPSCEKSIPFEYNKINPKVDYSKFTALMKEEKVERVVSETIKGNSLVNLMDNKPYQNTNDLNTLGHKFTRVVEDVTIIVYNLPSDKKLGISLYEKDTLEWSRNDLLTLSNSNPKMCYLPKLTGKIYSGIVGTLTELFGVWTLDQFKDLKIVALKGDWTDKEIPKYFTGLKSLSEEEQNLIEVKTGVIDEKTYDPCNGNVKLPSAPNITHVMSANTIIPTFEAEVKRGGTKLSDLTAFGKLDTVGDETVEFTKIKGKILHNLQKPSLFSFAISGCEPNIDFTTTAKVNEITINRITNTVPRYTYVNCGRIDIKKLKPNTKYTVVFEEIENIDRVAFHGGDTGNILANVKPISNNKAVLTTIPDFSTLNSNAVILYVYIDSYNTNTRFRIKNVMILEGDYTNTPLAELPFIEGIKSVGETEDNKVVVKRCGKNLFDKKDVKIFRGYFFHQSSNGVVLENNTTTSILFKNIPNTRLVISKKPTTRFAIAFTDSDTLYVNLPINNLIMNGETSTELLIENSGQYKNIMAYIDNTTATDEVIQSIIDSIQLEEVGSEISQATPFEPYKEYRQEIHLKEPLRSLPNGVCDEIVGNKVIRRIGQVILDGSENWSLADSINSELVNTICATVAIPNSKKYMPGLLCDNLPVLSGNVDVAHIRGSYTSSGGSERGTLLCYLNKNGLSKQDLFGVKSWFKQHPTTAYYELTTPIEEEIEHYYDKESIKTYQLDEPLRGLPNGIRDEIKDGVLIRRVGEIILNGVENWTNGSRAGVHTTTNWYRNDYTILAGSSSNQSYTYSDGISNKLPYVYQDSLYDKDIEGISIETKFGSPYSRLIVCIKKSRLASEELELGTTEFKKYLQQNPIKLLYELRTPIEIPLKEVNSNTADFSHKRHFKEGDYLREIPNGVKDEVVDNKVISRVGRIVLNGTENWTLHTSHSNHFSFALAVGTVESIDMTKLSRTTIISDKFPTSPLAFGSNDVGGIRYTNSIYISIDKTLLSTQDAKGFKAWLTDNPVTVLYELATPIETVKTSDNGLINPCHPFNTYCGSMYIGNGINEVLVENVIPKSKDIIIDTPFHEIVGRGEVDNCRYKKCSDGYNTMDKTSKSANLVDTRNFVNFVSTPNVAKVDTNVYPITLKSPKIKFSIFSNGVAIADDKFAIRFCDKDLKEITWWSTTKINREVELVPDFRKIAYIRLYHNNLVSTNKTIDGICITYQDGDSSKLVPFIPCEVAFENTEENDIEDLRHQVSLTGFNYDQLLNESFDKLLRGEL